MFMRVNSKDLCDSCRAKQDARIEERKRLLFGYIPTRGDGMPRQPEVIVNAQGQKRRLADGETFV
jgi:hypothetical protein